MNPATLLEDAHGGPLAADTGPPRRAPRDVVLQLLTGVRVTGDDAQARDVLAPRVTCHQVVSEAESVVERTPEEYAEHVRVTRRTFGRRSTFQVEELLADGDRVYVRWRQSGHHLGHVDGYPPTGLPLTEVASAVYRVTHGRVSEYWVQVDRAGLTVQLQEGVLS